jgi:hypothetical protein
MVSRVGSRLTLHFLVLTVSRGQVNFEIGPYFICGLFFIPSAAGAREASCGKDVGIIHVDLLLRANCYASCSP